MSLIARFVFENGKPLDFYVPKEEKEKILDAINAKKPYIYQTEDGFLQADVTKALVVAFFPPEAEKNSEKTEEKAEIK